MKPRARVALFKLAGAFLEFLPERIDVGLGQRLGITLGLRSARRANLERNLARVLAGPSLPPEPQLLKRYVRRGFANYGQYWAEGAKLPGLSPHTITSRFIIGEGREYLDDAFAQGRGVVIALPHIGSWEWGGSFLASLGMPMTAIARAARTLRLVQVQARVHWYSHRRPQRRGQYQIAQCSKERGRGRAPL